MTDQSDPEGFSHVPALVRCLLDPYVNVAGPPRRLSHQIEESFLALELRPTEAQLQAIGRVTTTWAVLEHVIEIALAKLAMAPRFPALALTNDLSIDNRIKGLKVLLSLHRRRYREGVIPGELLTALENFVRQIAPLKDERNRIAHLVWTQGNGDQMRGVRPRACTEGTRRVLVMLRVAEVNALADRIQALADSLFVLSQLVPEVDEGPHAQSLSRCAHLHRDTR